MKREEMKNNGADFLFFYFKNVFYNFSCNTKIDKFHFTLLFRLLALWFCNSPNASQHF